MIKFNQVAKLTLNQVAFAALATVGLSLTQNQEKEESIRILVANRVSRSWLEEVRPALGCTSLPVGGWKKGLRSLQDNSPLEFPPLILAEGPAQYVVQPKHPGEAKPRVCWAEVKASSVERALPWLAPEQHLVLPGFTQAKAKVGGSKLPGLMPPCVRLLVLLVGDERPEVLLAELARMKGERRALSVKGKVRKDPAPLSPGEIKEAKAWLKASIKACSRRQRIAEKTRREKAKERDSARWHAKANEWKEKTKELATLSLAQGQDEQGLSPLQLAWGITPSKTARERRAEGALRKLTQPSLAWMQTQARAAAAKA